MFHVIHVWDILGPIFSPDLGCSWQARIEVQRSRAIYRDQNVQELGFDPPASQYPKHDSVIIRISSQVLFGCCSGCFGASVNAAKSEVSVRGVQVQP